VNSFLDFEQPIADLEAKIEELRRVSDSGEINLTEQIEILEEKSQKLTDEIFSSLTAWQVTQLARHPQRPFTLDYVERMVDEFHELHGDRMFADDHAIVAGLGRLAGRGIAILGHQKGRDTAQKVHRNFGMPRPEGYRKAQRIMRLAERFRLPLLTLVDTPGAYPGIDAEERGQSEAIASSIALMASLTVPTVTVVIGEGGSGGALAIGVCDRLLMLSYATYSVISPEGCASILWKSAEKAPDAAEAMKMTSGELQKQGLIDEIVDEPLGGAHRDVDATAAALKSSLIAQFDSLDELTVEELKRQRYQKLMAQGTFEQVA
jgi:acetyl-CoA carboxylase carboxyl transferase subunit alpha